MMSQSSSPASFVFRTPKTRTTSPRLGELLFGIPEQRILTNNKPPTSLFEGQNNVDHPFKPTSKRGVVVNGNGLGAQPGIERDRLKNINTVFRHRDVGSLDDVEMVPRKGGNEVR